MEFFFFFFFFFSMGLTVSYTLRLIYFMLFSLNRRRLVIGWYDDSLIYVRIKGLVIMSLIRGSILSWLLIDYLEIIYLSISMKFFIFVLIILGFLIGNYVYNNISGINLYLGNNLLDFIIRMMFIGLLIVHYLSYSFIRFGFKLIQFIDFGWVEELGAQGLFKVARFFFKKLNFMSLRFLRVIIMSFYFWVVLGLFILVI